MYKEKAVEAWEPVGHVELTSDLTVSAQGQKGVWQVSHVLMLCSYPYLLYLMAVRSVKN